MTSLRREPAPVRRAASIPVVTMITDDTLVSECLRGDGDAFRLLVERHRPRLHGLACGILQNSDLASDAVQDAFLRRTTHFPNTGATGSSAPGSARILVNHCLSVLRQRHNHLSLEELDRDIASEERGPEEQALAGSDVDQIRRAMAQLPAHYRTALVLRVVEGLGYREVAQLLGVPESTVETWDPPGPAAHAGAAPAQRRRAGGGHPAHARFAAALPSQELWP